ncbi:hypothetical protein MLD38_025624 [Melastoma candidum]|uniref:Uncharacterized protein n=1 Tax=Melastoma candidum TaxID=119954 RepID=A0ACB9NWE4_9MYRT|nr:hypothetical protein MLD38_025624 [Melastoma candidum]
MDSVRAETWRASVSRLIRKLQALLLLLPLEDANVNSYLFLVLGSSPLTNLSTNCQSFMQGKMGYLLEAMKMAGRGCNGYPVFDDLEYFLRGPCHSSVLSNAFAPIKTSPFGKFAWQSN